MTGKDNEEQASMPKAVTEQEAKEALSAVFSACVATQIRAGKSEEEAMRICHASIDRQIRTAMERAQQSTYKPPSAEEVAQIFADIERQRYKEAHRGRISRFMHRISESRADIAFVLLFAWSIWVGIQMSC